MKITKKNGKTQKPLFILIPLSNNSDKNIKKLKNSVHKLFERFPPQSKD